MSNNADSYFMEDGVDIMYSKRLSDSLPLMSDLR